MENKSENKVSRKEIFGWAMFDFSNSGFTTVVITAIYGGIFTEYIVGSESKFKDTYWSFSIILATLIALVLSPLVGALCDLHGKKKKYLIGTCLLTALPTALLYFVGPGQIWTAIFLLAISHASFMISENFCGSFLPDLATEENMAKISGIGWGIGYFGGLVNLIIVQLIVTSKAETNLDLFLSQNQLAMLATGVFVIIAALPTVLFLKDRSHPSPGFENATMNQLFKAGLKRTITTFKEAKEHKDLFSFLWAFVFYYAGLSATINFAGIFARRELKFDTGDLVVMFLCIQLSAALGSYLFGIIEKKTGIKNNILWTLVLWFVSIFAIVILDPISQALGVGPKQLFFFVSIIVGLGLGATQSSSRAFVGMLCPPGRSAEMFGLWGMANRVAVLFSMATFGPLSDYLGSIQGACVLLLLYLVAGAWFLFKIPNGKKEV
ncbi:MAG: MFS transporter [Bdellovibrionota bacterium]|nr:MFS transporter [Bdellovibrionota bacterium]